MASLQKNVASQNITFCLVNATTGAALSGASVTVKVTKDNGSQAGGSGTVTGSGNGQYNYGPTQVLRLTRPTLDFSSRPPTQFPSTWIFTPIRWTATAC